MKPLKVKIIGSGGAAQKHRRAFEALPEMYQITESDDHDIVDICTPNYMHYQQVSAYLAAFHVIVEKPICGSLAEIDLLARIEERGAQRIIPIFQYRFAGHDPIGSQIINRWQRPTSYQTGWRGDWNQAFGGCLTSHGIHAIDLAIKERGLPFIVSAAMDTHRGVERFADVFMGEPGDMIRVAIMLHPDIEQGGFKLGDSHAGFVTQFRLTYEALTTGSPLPVTLAEARDVIEVLTAAYYSAYTGEPVMLPIEPSHPFYAGWHRAFAERRHVQDGEPYERSSSP